jgi:hypothetical protein
MLGISFDLAQMSNFSEAFVDVLRACLVFEPSQRISAKALNAMPFFSEKKSQDSERLAVFKEHDLESIDTRFAWLSHQAPIPILSEFPNTPKITSRWDFGQNDNEDSFDIAPDSSFPEISISSDLYEHRSHLENLSDALETKLVEVMPPDSPHLKALSFRPKVHLLFLLALFQLLRVLRVSELLLQCVFLDDSREEGRLILMFEALDRPRLLNDVTSVLAEESVSFLDFCSISVSWSSNFICLFTDYEITSAHIATEYGIVKDRLSIRPVRFAAPRLCLFLIPHSPCRNQVL